jgi:hypothetical protein
MCGSARRIFLGLGDAEDIAGGRQHDEQLVSPEHEAGEAGKGQPDPAGALDDIETRTDQRIAAECENHRRGVQRPDAPEVQILAEIKRGKDELRGDHHPDEEADHAPEQRSDHAPADDIVIIARQNRPLIDGR